MTPNNHHLSYWENSSVRILGLSGVILIACCLRFWEVQRPVPAYSPFYHQRGLDALKASDLGEAIGQFQQALFHDGNRGPTLYAIGKVSGKAGDQAGKIGYYKRAAALDTRNFPDMYLALGIDAAENGNTAQAKVYLRKGMEILGVYKNDEEKKLYSRLNYYLGKEYVRSKDYILAESALMVAAGFDPDWAQAHRDAAMIAIELGHKRAAFDRIKALRDLGRMDMVLELENAWAAKEAAGTSSGQ